MALRLVNVAQAALSRNERAPFSLLRLSTVDHDSGRRRVRSRYPPPLGVDVGVEVGVSVGKGITYS
jgi:hypothetical protein